MPLLGELLGVAPDMPSRLHTAARSRPQSPSLDLEEPVALVPGPGAGGTVSPVKPLQHSRPLVFPPARLLCHQPSAPRPGTMATGELTELETAIEKIVSIFFTYAAREGRTGTLTAGEFKELDVGSLDEKMSSLDVNRDEELKFSEYWRLIGELARDIKREKTSKKNGGHGPPQPKRALGAGTPCGGYTISCRQCP
ncbi:protein S100-A13 [Alligator mississippiensis]|uniref:Protein S100-A13 n=1 Tax=Alligator mississippiensis TaxID=8496 RepID=A0A151PIR8_ALLMI|nr:protein S100-A13 [Alligator mississippiensis]